MMAVDTDMATRRDREEDTPVRLRAAHDLTGAVLGGLGRLWMRHANVAGSALIAGFAIVVMVIGYLRPFHSWDMIAYIGVALSGVSESPAALHAEVWEIVREGVLPERFSALSEGDSYRIRQYTDPAAFNSMLPMYGVKLLYVKFVGLVAPLAGPMKAAFVINVFSTLLFAGTVCWWLVRTKLMHLAPIVLAILMVAGFPAMAMAETPDMMCAALLMSGILFLDRDKILPGSIATIAAVATRPDMAAYVGVLMAAAWFWSDRRLPAIAATFAACVVVYLAASMFAGHPGWWPHVWFSTYHIQETMVGFDPDFSLRVYATAFAWNVVRSAFENSWLGIYTGLLAGWALLHAGGLRFARERHVLIAACLAAVAAKFIVFPLHDGRVYLPLLVPAALLMLAAIRDAARYKPSVLQAR